MSVISFIYLIKSILNFIRANKQIIFINRLEPCLIKRLKISLYSYLVFNSTSFSRTRYLTNKYLVLVKFHTRKYKFCIIHQVVSRIVLVNQKYLLLNHNEFLKFFYEF
jgi:hypothetical protein